MNHYVKVPSHPSSPVRQVPSSGDTTVVGVEMHGVDGTTWVVRGRHCRTLYGECTQTERKIRIGIRYAPHNKYAAGG